MNDILFALLKIRFEGVSDALLIRVAEKLAKTVTEEEKAKAAVDAVKFQEIIDIEADRRVTDATKTAVINYEKKHGLKDGQKAGIGGAAQQQATTTTTTVTDDTPEWAKTQMKFMTEMNERIARMEGDKVITSRKQQLEETIKNASDGFKTQITKNFSYMAFKDDEAYSTWLEETKKDAETNAAEALVTGVPKGAGSGNKDEVSKAVKDYIESKKEGDGQPF